MKTLIQRVPFGKGRFEPIRAVRFLEGEQEFEVEFDSGGIGLLPNADLRRANGLLPKSTTVDSIWIDGLKVFLQFTAILPPQFRRNPCRLLSKYWC